MTCARCKRCPGLRMAGFRKFQQTSCITHNVFIAVEDCTPAMPFHTRLADDELHDLGSPSAAPMIIKHGLHVAVSICLQTETLYASSKCIYIKILCHKTCTMPDVVPCTILEMLSISSGYVNNKSGGERRHPCLTIKFGCPLACLQSIVGYL